MATESYKKPAPGEKGWTPPKGARTTEMARIPGAGAPPPSEDWPSLFEAFKRFLGGRQRAIQAQTPPLTRPSGGPSGRGVAPILSIATRLAGASAPRASRGDIDLPSEKNPQLQGRTVSEDRSKAGAKIVQDEPPIRARSASDVPDLSVQQPFSFTGDFKGPGRRPRPVARKKVTVIEDIEPQFAAGMPDSLLGLGEPDPTGGLPAELTPLSAENLGGGALDLPDLEGEVPPEVQKRSKWRQAFGFLPGV